VSSVRSAIGTVLKKIFFRPPFVKHSVQTIYKSLQGCIYLHQSNAEGNWLYEVHKLAIILINIQNPDGGFDTGYNYHFGSDMLHRKGQSLACETTALTVIGQYQEINPAKDFDEFISSGLDWIKQYSVRKDNGFYIIPYCPDIVNDTIIINGISFTAAAMGKTLKENDETGQEIYRGMISFLKNNMVISSVSGGRYWPYFEQGSTILSENEKKKIDYYHLAQQVEIHAIAQQQMPLDEQYEIIKFGADHLVHIHHENGIIPYDNMGLFDGCIHTWGLSSVIPAMIEASKIISENKSKYHLVATQTIKWIIDNAWNGCYFYDILTPGGTPVSKDYMVRSDAWCFQAFASYTRAFGSGPWTEIAILCYNRLKNFDFSGYEKHGKRGLQVFLEKFQHKSEILL
jgi:hypothetical protein